MKNKLSPVENLLVNRRSFLGSSIALLGGLSMALPQNAISASSKSIPANSKKAWAKKNLMGGEAFILPTMKPDLETLDEEGVRRDVRHAIAQGFCSIMPIPIGIDSDNISLMYKTIAEEAKDKIFMVSIILPGKWEIIEQRIRNLERMGFTHALMYFNHREKDQKSIYTQMHTIIKNTTQGIILYAKPNDAIQSMDPTGLPMDAFDRLADMDNVIGVKFTQTMRPATAYAVAERLGDRLLLGVIDLELMLMLSLKYKMQWTGQWAIDSLQSPEQPWVNQFLKLLSLGKSEDACRLYWRYEPIASFFYALQEPSLKIGGHPWVHIKYMKWLTGGNGGLLPDLKMPVEKMPHLDGEGRARCREIFTKVGIKTVDLPDEAFVVGNASYERGIRPKDMAVMPQYII